MGFSTIRCQKSLLATGNSDPEAAMEWLFGHINDPGMFLTCVVCDSVDWLAYADIDDPIQVLSTSISNSGSEPTSYYARRYGYHKCSGSESLARNCVIFFF